MEPSAGESGGPDGVAGLSDPLTPGHVAVVMATLRDEGLTSPPVARVMTKLLVWPLLYGLAVVGSTAWGGWATRIATVAVCAALLTGHNAIIHEALHHNLTGLAKVDDLVGNLFAAPLLLTYASYRSWHLAHHARTRVPGDPEPQGRLTRPWQYLLLTPVAFLEIHRSVLGAEAVALAGRPPSWGRPAIGWRGAVISAMFTGGFVLTMLGGTLAGAGTVVLWGWAVPVLVSLSAFQLAVGLPEHYGCGYGPAPVLALTRSTDTNPLVRFVMWNGNYHAEHHLAPHVPGAHLPRAHELLEGELVWHERSYLRFHARLLSDLFAGRVVEPPPDGFETTVGH